jgi:hypothetical protein
MDMVYRCHRYRRLLSPYQRARTNGCSGGLGSSCGGRRGSRDVRLSIPSRLHCEVLLLPEDEMVFDDFLDYV